VARTYAASSLQILEDYPYCMSEQVPFILC
jgi:hypothetical protein